MEMSNANSHCFLSISIAGQPARTVVIQLFPATCPKACENFVRLCSSPLKTSKLKPHPSYRGTEFHRIVDNFMVQAGDFEKFDGSGGYSPLTGNTFPDESFSIPHDRPGRVSMANRGPNTNGSQFFITLSSTTSSHLDGKHVCFGQVVEGMDVVHAITTVERVGSRPAALQRITVVDCGVGRGTTTSELNGSVKDDSAERMKARKERKKKKSSREHDDSSRELKKKQKKHHRKDDDSSPEQKKKHKRHRRYDHVSEISFEDTRKKKRSKREYDSESSDGTRERRKDGHKSVRP